MLELYHKFSQPEVIKIRKGSIHRNSVPAGLSQCGYTHLHVHLGLELKNDFSYIVIKFVACWFVSPLA